MREDGEGQGSSPWGVKGQSVGCEGAFFGSTQESLLMFKVPLLTILRGVLIWGASWRRAGGSAHAAVRLSSHQYHRTAMGLASTMCGCPKHLGSSGQGG
eukprot:1137216-Pelagomonas_calceolata.AAC.9